MRLVDLVVRGGHLSERAIILAVMTGDRPAHLDHCDLCSERALEIGRWLEATRVSANEAADAAFSPERLAAQQAQILRRLEQLDEPARVIAFPNHTRLNREIGGRRVAAGWVAVAAAAGLVLGVISGQWSAHLGNHPVAATARTAVAPVVQPGDAAQAVRPAPIDASMFDIDLDSLNVPALSVMDDMTPHSTQLALASTRSVK